MILDKMELDFKKSWKLKEFAAHNANVNCVALGRKSGRVIVTGGDDLAVNLWAIGKESCFMNLSGHTTPIDCVKFNHCEELVCSGSRTGTLKVWDLEAASLVRTLTGHRDGIRCIDFHPYGEFVASGSADNLVKIWDSRRKGCILTFPNHKDKVNSIKFSPDGQWIASGSDDCTIKIWDLRIGKVLKEFNEHSNSVTCVEFHPHEFLLASGSSDRSVLFFDLENFSVVSSEHNLGLVRSLCFNPEGDCLFVGLRDYLKVVGWEPSRLFDSVCVNWGRICDMSTAHNQLVGVSYHMTNASVHVANLKKIQPFGGLGLGLSTTLADSPSPFLPNQSIRKSFSKAERPMSLRNRTLDVKTIEESASGTDPEEESTADITNRTDYEEIFKPGRALNRTPPLVNDEGGPFAEPDTEPESYYNDDDHPHAQISDGDDEDDAEDSKESMEALSLDHNVNNYRNRELEVDDSSLTSLTKVPPAYSMRSKSNLDQIYTNRLSKQHLNNETALNNKMAPRIHKSDNAGGGNRLGLHRQSSCKDNIIHHHHNHHHHQEHHHNNRRSVVNAVNSMRQSVSEMNLNKNGNNNVRSRSGSNNSFAKPMTMMMRHGSNNSLSNLSKIPSMTSTTNAIIKNNTDCNNKVMPLNIINNSDRFGDSKLSPEGNVRLSVEEFIPNCIDRPVGLHLEDFLPKSANSFGNNETTRRMSESEVINVLMGGHNSIIAVFRNRFKNLSLVLKQCIAKDPKSALETACALNDPAIIIDLLRIINTKYSLWNLDICVLLLPKIEELVQSKFETYMTTACASLKLILRHFGLVIKSCVQTPVGSFGVDISREERYKKSVLCQEQLENIRMVLIKKQALPGMVGAAFKEIQTLMKNTLD